MDQEIIWNLKQMIFRKELISNVDHINKWDTKISRKLCFIIKTHKQPFIDTLDAYVGLFFVNSRITQLLKYKHYRRSVEVKPGLMFMHCDRSFVVVGHKGERIFTPQEYIVDKI